MKKIYTTFLSILALTGAMAQVPTTGLVSQYTFTGNANDEVGTVHGTVSGATLTTDRFGNADQAYDMAATQFISLGDNFDNITTGSGAIFTFSFWVKFSNVNATYRSIVGKASFESTCTTAGRQFGIRLNTANKLEVLGYGSITAGNYISYQTASTLSAGVWHHVVVGIDMATLLSGNVAGGLKVYLNNTLQSMSQSSVFGNGLLPAGMVNGPAHVGIGAILGTTGALCGTTQYLEGSFDDFRIYNRMLTAQEAYNLYTENIPQGGLVSRYSFDAGDATDDEGANDGTVTGATLTADRFGNPNQAYAFDGNDYINCGNNPTWNLLYSPGITMSAWVKTTASFSNSLAGILTRWGGISSGDEYGFFLANTTGRQFMAINTPTVGGVSSTTNVNDNAWHQVVFTFDKATGVHKMYLDGVQVYTNTHSGGIATISVPQNVLIGAQWGNGSLSRYFNGSIDDIGIYAEALSAQDVTTLYNTESSGCATPSITQDLSSVSYICPENGFEDIAVVATGDNLTYQWQSSPNGSSWSDISGETGAGYTATVAGYYRVVLSACGTDVASSYTQVTNANANTVTTILSSGTGTFCGSGTVTILTQVGTASSFMWAPGGETTFSITVSPSITTDYTVTATANATGCVASAQRTITVIPDLDNYPLYWNGSSLSVYDSLQNYQWWFGANAIPNANSSTYTPTLDGIYTLHFTYGGCSFVSEPYNFTTVGIAEQNANSLIVFPNPVQANLTIEATKPGIFILGNVLGETLFTQQVQSKTVISMEHLAPGIYILSEVNTGKTIKVIKE